jgi:hypothetical protein
MSWIYWIIASVIAIAFVNKSSISNWNLLWIVPAVVLGMCIFFWIAGAIFYWIIMPLLVVGVILSFALYLKDKV